MSTFSSFERLISLEKGNGEEPNRGMKREVEGNDSSNTLEALGQGSYAFSLYGHDDGVFLRHFQGFFFPDTRPSELPLSLRGLLLAEEGEVLAER